MPCITECLSAERFIKSTIRIDDRSPAAFSFGCLMIMTDEPLGGPGGSVSPIDVNTPVATYASIDDVAAEWDASSAVYGAALAAFSQNPGPDQVKVGFVATWDGNGLTALNDCDSGCYGYVAATLRDDPAVLDVAAWFEAQQKVFVTTTNDPLTKNATNATCIAEMLKQAGYDRTMVVYHDQPQYFPDAAFLAVALSYDFDQAGSSYTGKFKRLAGIPAVVLSSSEIQAVTGAVPHTGLVPSQGHFANTIACHCSTNIFVEGNMTSGRFFDSIHATDWIRVRIEEALCATLLRTHLPYTQTGLQIIADRVTQVLRQGQVAGVIAGADDTEGEFLAGFEVSVPRVANATAAQRANRVAPCVSYTARLTGAFHFVCATGTATVFNN